MHDIFKKPNQRITYYPMKTYLNLRNVSLALLTCTVLNSCSKDTDLLSEYLIRGAEKNEISSLFERADNSFKTSNILISTEDIAHDDFSMLENNRFANLPQHANDIMNPEK